MFGVTDLIVCMWLLPVVLYIILPLAMLGVWSVASLGRKSRSAERAASGTKIRGAENAFSRAGA